MVIRSRVQLGKSSSKETATQNLFADLPLSEAKVLAWAGQRSVRTELPSNHQQPEEVSIDNWFYVPSWKRTAFPRNLDHKSLEGGAFWLIFLDRWVGGTGFQRTLEAAGAAVQIVRSGEKLERRSDGSLEINPSRLDDYLSLIREIHGRFGNSINILHLGALAVGQRSKRLHHPCPQSKFRVLQSAVYHPGDW